jgi:hypothetical protein
MERSSVTAHTSTDPIELFFQHLEALKRYARRVVAGGGALTVDEEKDKARRLKEFIEIGSSFELTEKDMVNVIYRELFIPD